MQHLRCLADLTWILCVHAEGLFEAQRSLAFDPSLMFASLIPSMQEQLQWRRMWLNYALLKVQINANGEESDRLHVSILISLPVLWTLHTRQKTNYFAEVCKRGLLNLSAKALGKIIK